MLDIHTHLFWNSYDSDRDAVIARARDAGVKQMICVGTAPEDNSQAIEVAEKYDGIYASVGLHPHFFNIIEQEISDSKLPVPNKSQISDSKIHNLIEELRGLAGNSKVIAIGECGLDYFSRDPEKPITVEQKTFQKSGFLVQLALARELRLPLIIHTRPSVGSRDAYEDMYEILAHHLSPITHPASRCVLHCYQGDTEITRQFLELPDIYFSFAGSITYPVKKIVIGTKDDSAETVQLIPLERMFIETDCPFLAPQERRGQRNEPAYVRLIAAKVCELQGIAPTEMEAALERNFTAVFSVGKS